jgi:4'-phosphopantetheinyl transferase EntD
MNPALLSANFGALFPAGAVVAELREAGNPALLLPAEAGVLGNAVAKRVQEFAAGRLCARRALAEFGVDDFGIAVGENRQPIWPPNLTGSITHTTGFCAAVVAERRCAAALGIDTEIVGDVDPKIWTRICLPGEMAWIRSLPSGQQAAAVTLVFSAKEAFYKCQYPMLQERLDFSAVSIAVARWGTASGVFRVIGTPGTARTVLAHLPIEGRYLFHEEFVTAGIAWP